ncbi:MAG: TIGR04255 family protein [Chloroflexota bacterium]
MTGETLKKPPLVEAIFEIKWDLQDIAPGIVNDPHYNLLLGRMYDRLEKKYPFHQPLPTASIPTEMITGVVQHRFRIDKEKWPLFQLGPGILTVNDNKNYKWHDFKERVTEILNFLFEVYPAPLSINSLVLRYINSIEFNFDKENIFDFLSQQLQTEIALPASLFETDVQKLPVGFDCRFAFKCTKPGAMINLRLARGRSQNNDALIWESFLTTTKTNMPSFPEGVETWLEDSHNVLEEWFIKLIEGELLRSFK